MEFRKKLQCGFGLWGALLAASLGAQVPNPPTVPQPSAAVAIPPPPAVGAKSYVLMDYASGQVLAAHEAETPTEPASLTKMMTSYVVSAEMANRKMGMEEPVFISEHAWRTGGAGTDGSTSFLALNSRVPLTVLLHGMIIQSGNDASIALAEHFAGSEETFAQLMNTYAQKLGMRHTHFLNATGLPADGHVTTALDVAILSRALIRDYPEDYRIYAIKEFAHNGVTQQNRNTLLWRDAAIDGIKTGHTSRAGYCLAASAKQGNLRLIAVVMGTHSEKSRADEAQALLNYGFRFFESQTLYAKGAVVAEPRLWKGAADQAKLGVEQDVAVTVPRGQAGQLRAEAVISKPLLAPLRRGQALGSLKIKQGEKVLLEAPLVALADYPVGGFWGRFWDTVALWWSTD